MALRYVERYATTRAKLAAYLARKVRERGWEDAAPADPAAIAERFAGLGYVDDRAFAEARAAAMGRRGLGARRVAQALRFAGIGEEDAAAVAPGVAADAAASALAFARRRRIGPYAREAADRPGRERQVAAMVRAGHAPALAWRIARMAPGDDAESVMEDN
ncbi:MAG: RecX family transcriptional regulator [Sphingomonas sp.]